MHEVGFAGFFVLPQQYISCIDGFMAHGLWACTGGQLCAISVVRAVLGFTDKQGKAWSSNYTVKLLYDIAFLRVTNGCF